MNRSAKGQNTGAATRRMGTKALEAQYGGPGPINQSRPVSDPQNQTAASYLSFNNTARTVQGFITDTCAIGNVYRIQLEKNKQTVVGFLAPRTSCNLFGARELHTLQPGTLVTCICHEQMPWAQIIGVVPPTGSDARKNNHAVLHGATRNRVDEAHKRPMRMAEGGYIPAFLAGRPFDATCVGETGWVTETGVKAFVDSFMAMFGIEESCQISFHYHDMLARLAAYNFQLWTAVRESESFNDQDESFDWTGYAMYPWEQFGLAARADPTVIKTAQEWQIDQPWYSKMEPVDDHMMPWHREREFHGYLGQGGKHSVIAPPIEFGGANGDRGSGGGLDTSEGSRTEHASYFGGVGKVDAKHPGLFDSSVTADGRLLIQSAKGISLVKRATIMLPTRRRRPEDPNGDNETNYKASGVVGDEGEEHKITGDIETVAEENGNFNRAMGIMDMHAYFFNYAGVHPFFYHKEDFKLWDESDAEWADGKSEEVPNFGRLASEAYIDAADYEKTWDIDHRYGQQKFYTLSCGFELLDDGGVMITDGYGSSIRMTGGSVEISAPGDVWLKSGRNTNLWAGTDLIQRAKNSFDISATDGDGRIKVEKNMMVVAGNSGRGGLLLESRGAGNYNFDECGEQAQFAGVIIRSTQAAAVTWAPEVYLRTGGPGMFNGSIVLDAGRGKGSLVTYCDFANHYNDSGHYWHFGTVDEVVGNNSACMTATGLIMPGSMCLGGGVFADGSGVFNGSVAVNGNISATEPFVGELKDQPLQQVIEAIDRCRELIEQEVPMFGTSFIEAALTPRFYEDNQPGSDDVILKGEFSYRLTEDYRTENFKIFEDRWQQLDRLTNKSGKSWQEKPVTCQGEPTYPYPGREAFESSDVYVQQDLTIFDASNGRSKSRGEQGSLSDEYSEPKFAKPKFKSLNEYTVIR